jgi:soluble lytic murein transglycosylase-like protein
MSRPAADATSQLVPNGPRTPIRLPGDAACRARVTAPTARSVCSSRLARPPPLSPRPLTEMGTSPMPNAVSMANCPGAKAGTGWAGPVSSKVTVSAVSSRREATR